MKTIIALLLFSSFAMASVGKFQNADMKSFTDIQKSVRITTGNLTSGSACISGLSSTTGLAPSMSVYDSSNNSAIPNFATGLTTIVAIPGACSAGQVQMSANAAANATTDTIWFGGPLSELTNTTKLYDPTLGETMGAAIANGDILNSSTHLSVPQGGTGQTNGFIPFGTVVSSSSGQSLTSVSPGTSGQFLTSNGPSSLPSYQALSATYHTPSTQAFTGTNYYSFTISGGGTWGANDVYTNNGQTFTSIYASTVNGSTVYTASASGAPLSSGTLTRSSGSGSTTVTFTANTHVGTYYPGGFSGFTPLYSIVMVIGGGGGGGGGGTGGASGGSGGAGSATTFTQGANSVTAGGGGAGISYPGQGGAGGTISTSGTNPVSGFSQAGGAGGGGFLLGAGVGDVMGGTGGTNGSGGGSGLAGVNGAGVVGTRGGGGGGGSAPTNSSGPVSGGGGGGGGYVNGVVAPLSASYTFVVGSGGSAGSAVGSGTVGAAGGSGGIWIMEFYQ